LAFKRRKQKPISNLPEIADLKNTIEKIRILEAEREKLLLEIEGLRKKVKAKATRKRS